MAAAQRPRSPISILLPANDRPSPPWGITGASSNQAYSQMITKLKSIEPPLTLLGNRAFLALALSLSFCILTHHEIAILGRRLTPTARKCPPSVSLSCRYPRRLLLSRSCGRSGFRRTTFSFPTLIPCPFLRFFFPCLPQCQDDVRPGGMSLFY